MFHIFSDIFTRRDNFLARLDARTKLSLTVEIIVFAILSRNVGFPLAVLFLCLSLGFAIGIPAPLFLARMAAPAGIVCVLAVLQATLSGTTPLWVWHVWRWKITVTQEGLHTGLVNSARVFGSVSAMVLLGMVTPAHRIFQAMRKLRMPREWVEVAVLMYRYLFTLIDIAEDMTAAQRLRLGYSGVKRSMKSMGEVMGTVIIRSMDQAVRTHEAMSLRGCQGSIPFGPMPPWPSREKWLTALVGLFIPCIWFLLQKLLR